MSLNVNIVSSIVTSDITAADSLTLTCTVTGGTDEYSYQWSSCRTCFGHNQTTPSILQGALRSTDTGSYTCMAVDTAGNVGADSVDIAVKGERKDSALSNA